MKKSIACCFMLILLGGSFSFFVSRVVLFKYENIGVANASIDTENKIMKKEKNNFNNFFDLNQDKTTGENIKNMSEDINNGDLRLIGVVFSDSLNDKTAIISLRKKVEAYKLGDIVDGKFAISEINNKNVLFKYNNETFSLLLWESLPSQQRKQNYKKDVESKNSYRKVVDRSILKDIKNNPNEIIGNVNISPYEEGGFLISGVGNNSVFSEIGIKDKDVLIGIDGKKIKSPEQLIQAYSQVENSSLVAVEVLRNDKPTNLVLEIY